MTKPKKRPIFVLAEQLVQTWLRNETDVAELERLRGESARANAYMQKPDCNKALAMAYLDRVAEARRNCLLHLRSCRHDVLALIARASAELASENSTRVSSTSDPHGLSSSDCRPRQVSRKYA